MRKKILFLVLFSSIIITLGLVINEFLFKTTLTVVVTSPNANESINVEIIDTKSGQIVGLDTVSASKTSEFRVRPGYYDVQASQGTVRASSTSIRMKLFTPGNVEIPLSNEKIISKIGMESLGCDIYLELTLYSYSCTQPSYIVRHDTSATEFLERAVLFNDNQQLLGNALSKNGFISNVSDVDDKSFKLLNLKNNTAAAINFPNDRDASFYSVITSKESDKFALVNISAKEAIIYQNQDDKNPDILDLPLVNKPGDVSFSFYLSEQSFYVIEGIKDVVDDFKKNKKGERNVITEINLESRESREINLPDDFQINDATLFDNIKLAALNSTELNIFDIDSNNERIFHQFNVSSYVVADNTVYYIRDNEIFAYDSSTNISTKVFQSERLRLSRIFVSGGSLTFNAYVEGDKSNTLHSYVLTNEPLNGSRLEEKLPYISSSGLPIIKMDYGNDYIKVQLELTSFSSDTTTGEILFDTAEFEAKKSLFLKRIKEDNIPIPENRIFFLP